MGKQLQKEKIGNKTEIAKHADRNKNKKPNKRVHFHIWRINQAISASEKLQTNKPGFFPNSVHSASKCVILHVD